jgi:hypothetical protein
MADVIDQAKDRQAMEQVREKLMEIPEEKQIPIRVDVIAAAVVVLDVAHTIVGQVRERFLMLPKALFDPALLELLEPAARAAMYARREQQRDEVDLSNARVPLALVEEGAELKQRMFRVAEYHLADHPTAGKMLEVVRPGSGHQDTANDLMSLAQLYRDHRDVMAGDVAHFHLEDADEAEKIGDAIFRELGMTRDGKPRPKSDLAVRAWTHMFLAYEEVAAAGRWLFRKENGEAMFPPLMSAVRAPRSRSSKDKVPQGQQTLEPRD